MAGLYGTPPSLVTGLPSDSEEVSTFFNQLLHNSSSSCMTSKPKTLPPPWLSPPVGTAGFFRSEDTLEDPHTHRFAQLGSDSGSGYPLKIGKPVATSDATADSSYSFNFSDPYGYVPPDVKEASGKDIFSTGLDDSDANTSFKEDRISPENNPGDSICHFEKHTDASELPSKPVPPRSSSKRSRAAEVHNLSEKRRRSRINEKMKALQNLIPNSNKTDKASMLDEAIEYLKQLQLQVQMLMMRNGLGLHPMCLPGGLQPMILPQAGLNNLDEGHGFQNTTGEFASSVNVESLVKPALSLPKHCGISNQPVDIPSMANIMTSDTSTSFQSSVKVHVGHFNPSTSSKDALCDGTPELLLDTTRIGKAPTSDAS